MVLLELRKVTQDRLARKLKSDMHKFETIDEVINYGLDAIEVMDKLVDDSYVMSVIDGVFDQQKADRITELEEELESLKAGVEA
ncbi:MAG: hypothetical protein JRN37_01385 [Nitrososphaerota archaeon]|nr:hypothetical protein [Nitrososphaerota archaeon]MDG7036129.1 hypothetical protein [Nitrososphaerota archaeon]MDG7037805.1 hypothetical protein [Nitrososphaerota archaeon]